MSKEIPSFEDPTFDPDALPSEATLHAQAETDLELFEQGDSPDEIVEARRMVRGIHERIEPELDEIEREVLEKMERGIFEDE